jgi:hypothetical protein
MLFSRYLVLSGGKLCGRRENYGAGKGNPRGDWKNPSETGTEISRQNEPFLFFSFMIKM